MDTNKSERSLMIAERSKSLIIKDQPFIYMSRASSDYVNAMRDGDDGRPDWEARKTCNYDTALLLDCPKHLIGHCHTEEQVAKTSFWESKDESDYQDIKDWDSDKCPAVK